MHKLRKPLIAVLIAGLLLAFAVLLDVWWLILSLGLLILGVFGYAEDILSIQIPKRVTAALLILFIMFSVGQMLLTKHQERLANRDLQSTREALATATNEIAELKFTTDALARYAPWAKLNGLGKTGLVSGLLTEDSDLIRLLAGCITTKNGQDTIATTPEARAKYAEAIDKFPDFPFPYCYMALYYHAKGDTRWHDCAAKAEMILTRTTAIAAHNTAHDAALKQVQELMNGRGETTPNKMPRHVP